MKIAILSTIENYSWAGTEEVWYQFAQFALNHNHNLILGANHKVIQHSKTRQLMEQGMQAVPVRPFRPMRFYLIKERINSDLRKIFDFDPDFLIINSGSLYDITNLPYLFSFVNKIKCRKIFYCHFVAEGLKQSNPENVKSFLQNMDHVVFVSNHNKSLAQRQLAYQFPISTVIINQPKLMREKVLPYPNSDVVKLACVARFETLWKGQDVLLEVLSRPPWRDRSWVLNLYGSGPDENYIRNLIDMYDLSDRVSIVGYVENVVEIWKDNHLMVLASRGEGTPLAVLEAMMCCRPTVTTDAGGNREILEEGKTGWIADVATPDAFERKLEIAWESRKNWKQMGELAHAKARELFEKNPPRKLMELIESI